MDLILAFNDYLEKQAMKKTAGRDVILKAVSSLKGHFDADELLAASKKKNSGVSRASVYRTIPLLVKAGLLNESVQRGGRRVYEASAGRDHHDHMVCTNCGAIIEFRNDEIEKLQETVGKSYGFNITGHSMELKGICRRCSAKQ